LASKGIIKECLKKNSAITESNWNISFENLKNKTSDNEENYNTFEFGELTNFLWTGSRETSLLCLTKYYMELSAEKLKSEKNE
jgi:hypothetical protein